MAEETAMLATAQADAGIPAVCPCGSRWALAPRPLAPRPLVTARPRQGRIPLSANFDQLSMIELTCNFSFAQRTENGVQD